MLLVIARCTIVEACQTLATWRSSCFIAIVLRGSPSTKIVDFKQQRNCLLVERKEEEESSRQ